MLIHESQRTKKPVERMDRFWLVLYLFAGAILASTASSAIGQIRKESKFAVDVIQLKNQKQIRGFVLGGNPNEDMTIAVSKAWLEKQDQNAFLKTEEAAKQQAVKARQQLADRLKALLHEPAPIDAAGQPRNGAFEFFLRRELERTEGEIENPPDDEYQFLVLRIKSLNLSNINLASEANRKIAIWSWHEGLKDVELRTPSSLVNELAAKKIDVMLAPPELDSRFCGTEENDNHWTVRLAIVSHRLVKPIEMQGSGDVMLLLDDSQQPNVASMMERMMQSQMNSLIRDLTGGTKNPQPQKMDASDWIKSALLEAEKIKASYFRATCVHLDPFGTSAKVESAFMVKLDSGKWTMGWQAVATQSPDQQKIEAIKRIESDPQVKAIKNQFGALGGSATMDQALKTGAATMTAQNKVNVEFQMFVERHLKQLSRPPIRLVAK